MSDIHSSESCAPLPAYTLLAGIKRMGEWIGIEEKGGETETVTDEQASEMVLVGAMFVTGESFDVNLGRKGLDKFKV